MEDKRQVSEDEAKRFAEENNLSFLETSAKLDGEEGNVEKAFMTLVSEIMSRQKDVVEDDKDTKKGTAVVSDAKPVVITDNDKPPAPQEGCRC